MNIEVFTGAVAGGWNPNDVDNFLSANEETVVLWSEALVRAGYPVTVYASLRGVVACERNGVKYKQRETFDPLQERECLITYKDRRPWSMGADLCSKLRIHWSMDVEPRWPDASLGRIHYFGTLGPMHESTMPWLPLTAIRRLPLGIDLKPMLKIIEAEKKPREEIALYTTSPDRGLATLLSDWPLIAKAHPGLRLLITYDFNRLINMGGPQGGQVAQQLANHAQAVGAQITGALPKEQFFALLARAKYYIHPINRRESDLFGYGAFRAEQAGLVPVLNYFDGYSFADTLSGYVPYRDFLDNSLNIMLPNKPPVQVLSWDKTVKRDWLPLLKGPDDSTAQYMQKHEFADTLCGHAEVAA